MSTGVPDDAGRDKKIKYDCQICTFSSSNFREKYGCRPLSWKMNMTSLCRGRFDFNEIWYADAEWVNDTPVTKIRSKSKLKVEFQYGGRPFPKPEVAKFYLSRGLWYLIEIQYVNRFPLS